MKRVCIAVLALLLLVFLPLGGVKARADKEDSEIVIERDSGRILFEKNAREKRGIASLTKIITAIVAIENADLDRQITVPAECCGIEGSSVYLKPGERLTLSDLLYAMMLRSGNDAALAVAVSVGGSVENFVAMMNDFARRIGAHDTHFANPHGLNAEGHYSTAYDTALCLAYAMKNETFRSIAGCKNKTIPGEEGNRYLKNKNKLLFSYDACTGGKTGYTVAAGRCLASAAQKDGMELVSVVLGCSPMYENSQKNFEDCFARYSLVKIVDKDEFRFEADVFRGKNKAEGYVKESFCYPLADGEREAVRTETVPDNAAAPLSANEKIGVMNIYLENQLIFSQKIFTIFGVDKKFDFREPLENWAVW